jgi:VWFA-related protein
MTLNVVVTNKSHAPVRGLSKSDFVILDNKSPQPIVSFQAVDSQTKLASDPPVEVILLVDAVNTGPQSVAYERNEIRSYLLRNGGELPRPVSLIVLTDFSSRMQPVPSRDGKALAALYDQYETGTRSITRSQGVYGAADRIGLSLNTLKSLAAYEQSRTGRKLVIWISPGWPLLSGPEILPTLNQQKELFGLLVSTDTALRNARITLYSVDPLGLADAATNYVEYYKDFLKGVAQPSNMQFGNLGLQVFAVHSGGAVYNSTNDLASSIASCVADADSYYILTFDPPPATHPDEYHSLEVRVEGSHITARTRTGYYAQP